MWGSLGARSGLKMLRVQGREKRNRSLRSRVCSRHSELSGEPRRKEERERTTPFFLALCSQTGVFSPGWRVARDQTVLVWGGVGAEIWTLVPN
ncbi:hypothetical protein PFLUV_G00016620 [Perca fluviatilis]|uniref:Uncharacterized protein n=1 Tax=Perca fluviatilis TaxID=8168 RepID=A0A6A5FR39_PERFL|nr:hypothetical protein PFLUV_G00016620 [Perca fluviatilis]